MSTVPAALTRWIEEAAVFRGDPDRPLVHLPDPATALVFRVTADGHAGLVVVGPRTRASYYRGAVLPFCLRLRVRPGRARPLFGEISDLVDRSVPLAQLWGDEGERLDRELVDVGPAPHRVLGRLETALLDRIGAQSTHDLVGSDLSRAALRALASHRRPVPAVAAHLNVSERHLRALFARHVGLSPKQFARIDRVRGVLAGAGDRRWARLAIDAGYYDQAHMIADFRTMMGVPPAAYLAGRLPAVSVC